MMRAVLSKADLLRVHRRGGLSLAEAAEQLGFVLAPMAQAEASQGQQVVDSADDPSSPALGSSGTSASTEGLPPISVAQNVRYFAARLRNRRIDTLAESAPAGPQWPAWLQEAPPLTELGADPPASVWPQPESLVPWRRVWPALRWALGAQGDSAEIDVDRLLLTMGRGHIVRTLPKRRVNGFAPQALVLLDLSSGLKPFHEDWGDLLNGLRRQRGCMGLQTFALDGPPGHAPQVRALGMTRRQPWRMPESDTRLVIFSDLGANGERQLAASGWLAFGRALMASGIKATVFCPSGLSMVEPDLHQVFLIQCLDQAAALRPGVPDQAPLANLETEQLRRGVATLKAMLAISAWATPALVRALRRLLGTGLGDVSLEALLLADEDIDADATGCGLRHLTARLGASTAFCALPPALKEQAVDLIMLHHRVMPYALQMMAAERCQALLPGCLPGAVASELKVWRAAMARTGLDRQDEQVIRRWLSDFDAMALPAETTLDEVARARCLMAHSLVQDPAERKPLPFEPTEFERRMYLRQGQDPAIVRVYRLSVHGGGLWIAPANLPSPGVPLVDMQSDGAPLVVEVKIDPPQGTVAPSNPTLREDGSVLAPGPVRGWLTDYFPAHGPEYAALPVQTTVVPIKLDQAVLVAALDQHVVSVRVRSMQDDVRIDGLTKPRGAASICQGPDGLIAWMPTWRGQAHALRWTLGPTTSGPAGERQMSGYWEPLDGGIPGDIGIDTHGVWAAYDLASVDRKFARSGQNLRQRHRYIEPTTFLMGSPESEPERYGSESPQHPVVLTQGYWLAETACTQALWQAVMGDNPAHFKADDQGQPTPLRPVENVSWNDVQSFVGRLNQLIPGLDAGLPTEAQWENACRAGTITPFSFGSSLTSSQANFDGNNPYNGGEKSEFRGHTVDVGSLPANPWGLYEMHGNVWEWCWDGLREYQNSRAVDPVGSTESGAARALRGGSWFDFGRFLRSADRNGRGPGIRYRFNGFRLAPGQSPAARAAAAASGSVGQASERSRASRAEAPDDAAAARGSGLLDRLGEIFRPGSKKSSKKSGR